MTGPLKTPPGIGLRCRYCDLRPGGAATIGMLAEHFIAEHPETLKDNGDPRIDMDMIVTCLECVRDDGLPPECEAGSKPDLYVCPNCGVARYVRSSS